MSAGSRPVGYLTFEDLLQIAEGVIGEVALREPGLLASAAARPTSTVFGEDAYPTFAEKAAARMHAIARNHALVDGNKRLAWSATRIFCNLNGLELEYSIEEAEALVVGVAAGELDLAEIVGWLEKRIRDPE